MKVVLVTGATGALGRVLVKRLTASSRYHIVATSRKSHIENKYQLDIRDPKQIAAIINHTKPDLILHLAATFANDFEEAYAVNVDATRHLLETVQNSGLPSRVVLIGSAAEYGVVRPEENPIREDHVLNPVSIYGVTKAWQTQLATLYSNRGVNVVVARVFNLDGPGLSERLFIGRLQTQINEVLLGRKSAIELGSLAATRDYISTEEAADQILAISKHGQPGRVYQVASGTPVKMRDILIRYLAMHRLDASIVHEGEALTNRIGYDVPVIYADTTSTKQLMKTGVDNIDA